jgi:flagellar biosynthesis protein FliQ
MTPVDVMAAARMAMMGALILVSPFLLAALVASLVMGLIQASTRMTDLTLGFVPRFAAVMLVAWLAATWAGQRMMASIERSAVAMQSVVE